MDGTRTMHGRARRHTGWVRWLPLPALALLAGCVTTQFETEAVIPQPLVTRIPVVVGLYVPPAFREAVHREKRDGTDYAILLTTGDDAGTMAADQSDPFCITGTPALHLVAPNDGQPLLRALCILGSATGTSLYRSCAFALSF